MRVSTNQKDNEVCYLGDHGEHVKLKTNFETDVKKKCFDLIRTLKTKLRHRFCCLLQNRSFFWTGTTMEDKNRWDSYGKLASRHP